MRNKVITVFVVLWLALFHYESLRYHYLNPLLAVDLPKFKFLFPPAGWIMFYRVGETEVRAEVYGVNGSNLEPIDPHRIFDNHWLGYDNIRRNVLISILNPQDAPLFCKYLRRKFPQYDSFSVAQVIYPSNIKYPGQRIVKLAYRC